MSTALAPLAHTLMCAGSVALSVAPALAQCDQERQRVESPAGPQADTFGLAVALGPTLAIVSAPGDDSAGMNAGLAYVYRRLGPGWVLDATLSPQSASAGDDAGRAVAISGDFAFVGAPLDDPTGALPKSGSVAVFRRKGPGTWAQTATLTHDAPEADDIFGTSLAADGPVIVVGAPGRNLGGTLSGAARVFRLNETWIDEGALAPAVSNPFQFFGDSVAISADSAAVGAAGDNQAAEGAGAVYVYRHDGASWQPDGVITAPFPSEGGEFGKRIALSGDLLAATSPSAATGGPAIGAVYLFRRSPSGTWDFEAILTPDNPILDEAFGISVALDGGLAVAGASWQDKSGIEQRWAYGFRRSASGWSQVARLMPAAPVANEVFAFNVSLRAGEALLSSFNKVSGGGAYVWDLSGCTACYTDCNGDQALTIADFACFQTKFVSADPYADCNASGSLTIADFACFQTAFVKGCP